MKTLKQILEVDNRSKYEKIKALVDHPSTPEGIRNNAKAALSKAEMAPPSAKPSTQARAFPGPGADWSREEKHDYHRRASEAHNNGHRMSVKEKNKENADYHWNEKQHHDLEAEKYKDDDDDGTYSK